MTAPNSPRPFVFIRVPKTGSDSMRHALGRMTGHFTARSPVVEKARREHGAELVVAGFCRHPMDRAVSLFHWFRMLTREPDVKRVGAHYGISELCAHPAINAANFWESVDVERMRKVSPMFLTQRHYLRGPKGAPETVVFRFEEMATEWERFTSLIGRPGLVLPRVNGSGRNGVPWGVELTHAAQARIRGLFAVDFEEYGYE